LSDFTSFIVTNILYTFIYTVFLMNKNSGLENVWFFFQVSAFKKKTPRRLESSAKNRKCAFLFSYFTWKKIVARARRANGKCLSHLEKARMARVFLIFPGQC